MAAAAATHLHDLPEPLLLHIFSLISDVRARNAVSLACHRWRHLERTTRSALALRGHLRPPFLLPPASFPSVSHLDLSLLSPWGHDPFFRSHSDFDFPRTADGSGFAGDDHHLLVAARLARAFPLVDSLVVYARDPSALSALAPHWSSRLRRAKLVRWHQRPSGLLLGDDLAPLFKACPRLAELDLSEFYCWTEDVPQALRDHPAAAASLTRLDLRLAAATEGFRSSELAAVAEACPNLTELVLPCVFDPRCFEFVGDEALLGLAASCPRLAVLHLLDPATLSPGRSGQDADKDDAGITAAGLEGLFAGLPLLEDFALDLRHNVRDAGRTLEVLGHKCHRLRSLKLGQFLGVCKGVWEHLDGVSVCGGLVSLCIKNSPDLTDASLATIARGCRRLARFEIHGCDSITEMGIKKFTSMLRPTLVEARISGCQLFDATRSLRALEPVRDRLERLHIDCIWVRPEPDDPLDALEKVTPSNGCAHGLEAEGEAAAEDGCCSSSTTYKKCRYSECPDAAFGEGGGDDIGCFWLRTWSRLRYLSLWLPAGEVLTPLADAGLEDCPNLEEVCIKVEGDCRTCPKPSQLVFGLSTLYRYPLLEKMKLDCGEAIGYALTAPRGQMDLSLWERFYLQEIEGLQLKELDYWPPQDKDVNQRSLSLPAAGLIQRCASLRKLFIHGTAHEHFMRFFLQMPNLRDVQLREDYYPAPENDMSTEMRVDSCNRFENALNARPSPD